MTPLAFQTHRGLESTLVVGKGSGEGLSFEPLVCYLAPTFVVGKRRSTVRKRRKKPARGRHGSRCSSPCTSLRVAKQSAQIKLSRHPETPVANVRLLFPP